jgi:outer membrane lipoprotein carrier protein
MSSIRPPIVAARVLLGAFAISPASMSAQTSTVVDKAVGAWANVKSLSGTFEQTLTNPLMRSTTTARGSYREQRPNKLAIRFTEPAGDAIVADGQYLWVYLPQAAPNQVRKLPATDQAEIPIDMSQFLDHATQKFDIVEKGAENVGDRPAHALALTPKASTPAVFARATVWVDDADGLVRQFEVTEHSGLIRRIRLTLLTVNPTLTASDFSFTPPKGVKIITP